MQMNRRKWLVAWLYLVAVGHVLVAIAMTLWDIPLRCGIITSRYWPASGYLLMHW